MIATLLATIFFFTIAYFSLGLVGHVIGRVIRRLPPGSRARSVATWLFD